MCVRMNVVIHKHDANILRLITEVKQSWARLIHGWMTVLCVWYMIMPSYAALHIYSSGTQLGKKG